MNIDRKCYEKEIESMIFSKIVAVDEMHRGVPQYAEIKY